MFFVLDIGLITTASELKFKAILIKASIKFPFSDRYKAFLDFFNLSNYLVPREYLPPLLKPERTRLASVCMPSIDQETGEAAEIGEC